MIRYIPFRMLQLRHAPVHNAGMSWKVQMKTVVFCHAGIKLFQEHVYKLDAHAAGYRKTEETMLLSVNLRNGDDYTKQGTYT